MVSEYEAKIPTTLIEAFDRPDPPILLVGSGVGQEADPKICTAEGLAEEVCKTLSHSRDGENLSELLQYLKNHFNRSDQDLSDWLKRTLLHGKAKPTMTHRLLLGLPTREILTTNYDTLLQEAAEAIPGFTLHVLDDPKHWPITPPPPTGDDGYLGRVHGGFEGPFLVATTDDYIDHYRRVGKRWMKLLGDLFGSRVVVFIGYSLRDFTTWTSYVSARLRKARAVHGHFMVAPSANEHVINYWKLYGVGYIGLTAREFLIALHRRLGTFSRDETTAAAVVGAALRVDFATAQSAIGAKMTDIDVDDYYLAAEYLVNEACA